MGTASAAPSSLLQLPHSAHQCTTASRSSSSPPGAGGAREAPVAFLQLRWGQELLQHRPAPTEFVVLLLHNQVLHYLELERVATLGRELDLQPVGLLLALPNVFC